MGSTTLTTSGQIVIYTCMPDTTHLYTTRWGPDKHYLLVGVVVSGATIGPEVRSEAVDDEDEDIRAGWRGRFHARVQLECHVTDLRQDDERHQVSPSHPPQMTASYNNLTTQTKHNI